MFCSIVFGLDLNLESFNHFTGIVAIGNPERHLGKASHCGTGP